MQSRLIDLDRLKSLKLFLIVSFLALMLAVIVVSSPIINYPLDANVYFILHTALESIAVVIASSIFLVCWRSLKVREALVVKWTGGVFLAVAVFDLAHLLTFSAHLDTSALFSPQMTVDYWLVARLYAAVGILGIGLLSSRGYTLEKSRLIFAPMLFTMFVLLIMVLNRPGWIPDVIDNNQVLTPFKRQAEYLIMTLNLVACLVFVQKSLPGGQYNYTALALAAFISSISEYFFTVFQQMSDMYALTGHVFKIIAYLVLFKALYIETIERPWKLLSRADQRLRLTLGALPDVLFELDVQGSIVDVKSARDTGLIYSLEDFIGKGFHEVLPDESARQCAIAMQKAIQNQYYRDVQVLMYTLKGARYFSLSFSYLPPTENDAARFLVIARDTHDAILDKIVLQRHARLMEVLLQISREMDGETNESVLEFATKSAMSLTESRYACFSCLDNKGNIISKVNNFRSIDIPDNLVREVINRKEALYLSSDLQLHEIEGRVDGSGEMALCLPLTDRGETRLLLCVKGKTEHYEDQDLKVLEILGTAILKHFQESERRQEINTLSMALEQSPNSIMISSLDGVVQYVNKSFIRNSGFSRDELIGAKPSIVKSGKNQPDVYEKMWSRLLKGQPWQGELINRRKDGTEIPERVLIYPVRDDKGNIVNYISHKEDLTLIRNADNRINSLMNYDQLTQLPNRNLLEERFIQSIRLDYDNKESTALLYLNVDDFRTINEELSREMGDEVLCLVASRLRMVIGAQETISRLFGDTFVILMPGVGRDRAAMMASSVVNALQTPLWVRDHQISITVSLGISHYPGDGESLDILLMRAEAAMLQVKNAGRNNWAFFDPETTERKSHYLEISSHLKDAIANNALYLVYQPQYSLKENRVIGAEVLLRWHDPVLGQVSPADFIPIAESNGYIIPVSDWVLETACEQLSRWSESGMDSLVLAINLSAVQFRQPRLANHLEDIVSKHTISSDRIEFELTEAVALKDPTLASTTMEKLRSQGFHLSIDDFGTGYSSMSYLKRFEVEKLKIDQSFIKDITSDEHDRAIVKAIIKMAKSLKMKTIAEGVETEEQLEILRRYGCDEIQGYYYSRPLPATDFHQFMSEFKVLH